ncbi:MAG: 2Fe-2S iron-sulfur cluster-binding protein, partial [Syntrophobacterales bacterium]
MANKVSIELDGGSLEVQAGITVQKAMELSGYKISKYPEHGSLFTPCETGGCWSCTVEVNGEPKPACSTTVSQGLTIKTKLPEDYIPRRIITGFSGHPVGGVGTPWELK